MDDIEREALEQSIGKVDEALQYLYEAKQALTKSHAMGILDILGIDRSVFYHNETTYKKRAQMSTAEECVGRAARALRQMRSAIDVDIPELGLKKYATEDTYADGPIPDILTQMNINKARETVDQVILIVESLKRRFEKRLEAEYRPLF